MHQGGRLAIEEIPRSHLAFCPVVDRRFDRFDQHQASGLARMRKDVLSPITFKPRFGQRREERRSFGLGIVPRRARGHGAMTTRSAVACNIAIPWGGLGAELQGVDRARRRRTRARPRCGRQECGGG